MNILLWILQGLLALLYLSGGAYKVFKYEDLAKQLPSIPTVGWRAFGIVEMVGGLLLFLPALLGSRRELIPLAAMVLAAETFLLAALYGRRSVKLVAANPFGWAVVMAMLVALVAYGRYALLPL